MDAHVAYAEAGSPSYPGQMEYKLCGDLCTMAVKQDCSELPGDQLGGSRMMSELRSRTSGHRTLQYTSMFANCSLAPHWFNQIFFFWLLKAAVKVSLIKTNVFLKNTGFCVLTFPGEQTFVVEIPDQFWATAVKHEGDWVRQVILYSFM